MNQGFKFFPDQASKFAVEVDTLYFVMLGLAVFFALLIFSLIYIFAVRYRRRSEDEVPQQIPGMLKLELLWSGIPFVLVMGIFWWGATLYFDVFKPPKDAMEIYVVGKQWMWYVQHPTGQREINELHVPVGQPVKLTMTTEDVIHSFFIPAFRVKKDVVPGRYTTMWFEATKTGKYHLFCAEYCGTEHSGMRGTVVVMDPPEYQDWLSGGAATEPLEVVGERKFQHYACQTCHANVAGARGPTLVGLFGKTVTLEDGSTVVVNEEYIRESVLNPNAKIAKGYKPVMPTFKGQVTEVELLQITAYIKSLAAGGN
jgi:cytochrome c oxidase subunit 2